MSSTDFKEQAPGFTSIELPAAEFNPSGVFWLEPSVIQEVDMLINATQLPTMALGAETHAGEMAEARQRLEAILCPVDDPLIDELKRAVDIGFMYGGLIAKRSRQDASETAESEQGEGIELLTEYLEKGMGLAVDGLDPDNTNDSYLFFMRLRSMELRLGHSDILAFSLATTQDHMGREFSDHHGPEKTLNGQQKRRLQSVYYAGALAGAVLNSGPANLTKPAVEIMRSMAGPSEPVSIRMEFEPGDNLEDALSFSLGSKLSFAYIKAENGGPYFAVVPNGLQYGPNALSLPIFVPGMEEPDLIKKVPLAEVEALVATESDETTGRVESLRLMNPATYEETEFVKIAGLVLPEVCVGAFDQAHPSSKVIRELVRLWRGPLAKSLPYSFGLEAREEPTISNKRKIGAVALAGMLSTWIPDAINATQGNSSIKWQLDLAINGLIAGGAALVYRLNKRLKKQNTAADQTYQNLLDQITLPQ